MSPSTRLPLKILHKTSLQFYQSDEISPNLVTLAVQISMNIRDVQNWWENWVQILEMPVIVPLTHSRRIVPLWLISFRSDARKAKTKKLLSLLTV